VFCNRDSVMAQPVGRGLSGILAILSRVQHIPTIGGCISALKPIARLCMRPDIAQ